MARDRKRAKQRQRRAAQRQPRPARGGRESREPEAKIDPDQTIPDLEHGSANADIAKAAIAAGADGVFLEFHPDPEKALCDGPSCLPLADAKALLSTLKALHGVVQAA